MKVAVTGSSGLIGSALVPALRAAGHEPLRLVRRPTGAADEVRWSPEEPLDTGALAGVGAIVHLAGQSIDGRWTARRKRAILESRTHGTRRVAEAAAALEPHPVLLCASAMGFYGDRGDEELPDGAPRGEGFLAGVVEAWEAAADPARAAGVRVVHFRHTLVLSRRGGALARMLLPFRLGLGGPIGSGRQWWSWIALDDLVGAYLHALSGPLEGPVNAAAPEPVRNRDFARALGRALHRPAVLPVPAFAVRAVFGEMGRELLLASARVLPTRLQASGYAFRHRTLDAALAHEFAA
ncbi:MAG TPA: TIGR01777 family oxidoreductase [Gaiellaceae bacterium]|nr:TIGR01777 family oxidoreductase [Gaiellaceae bacterium]